MAMKARMKGGPRQTCTSLQVMVKGCARGLWPTPTAADVHVLGTTPEAIARADSLGQTVHLAQRVRWPTPRANERMSWQGGLRRLQNGMGIQLGIAVKLWPTPKSSPSGPDFARANRPGSGGDDLATAAARDPQAGGSLNPTWVEWLMGWPLGWTDCAPLEMAGYHRWRQSLLQGLEGSDDA